MLNGDDDAAIEPAAEKKSQFNADLNEAIKFADISCFFKCKYS